MRWYDCRLGHLWPHCMIFIHVRILTSQLPLTGLFCILLCTHAYRPPELIRRRRSFMRARYGLFEKIRSYINFSLCCCSIYISCFVLGHHTYIWIPQETVYICQRVETVNTLPYRRLLLVPHCNVERTIEDTLFSYFHALNMPNVKVIPQSCSNWNGRDGVQIMKIIALFLLHDFCIFCMYMYMS